MRREHNRAGSDNSIHIRPSQPEAEVPSSDYRVLSPSCVDGSLLRSEPAISYLRARSYELWEGALTAQRRLFGEVVLVGEVVLDRCVDVSMPDASHAAQWLISQRSE